MPRIRPGWPGDRHLEVGLRVAPPGLDLPDAQLVADHAPGGAGQAVGRLTGLDDADGAVVGLVRVDLDRRRPGPFGDLAEGSPRR